MSDSSDSSKPRPKTAAVPHYTVGEEIMNSVTHGVGCLLGIAGLVLLIVFAALRGGAGPHGRGNCLWRQHYPRIPSLYALPCDSARGR